MELSEYVISLLKQNETNHVFGIPGTSCDSFFDAIDGDPEMSYFVTVNELEAGYAADGYGRGKGIGVVCVSYGVGTLSLVKAVAGGFT